MDVEMKLIILLDIEEKELSPKKSTMIILKYYKLRFLKTFTISFWFFFKWSLCYIKSFTVVLSIVFA